MDTDSRVLVEPARMPEDTPEHPALVEVPDDLLKRWDRARAEMMAVQSVLWPYVEVADRRIAAARKGPLLFGESKEL